MSGIAQVICQLREQLPPEVTLIAVSKTHPADCIREAYVVGQKDFGENKVQEIVAKHDVLPSDIRWHMIGHLQTNKVKYIAPFVYMIHSVDTPHLLTTINKEAAKAGRRIKCLLQLHVAAEESKFGFTPQSLLEYLSTSEWQSLPNVEICGLMAMATNTDNRAQIADEFNSVVTTFSQLKNTIFASEPSFSQICMGMSGDYDIAIASGATMVRIGTRIFGARDYSQTN